MPYKLPDGRIITDDSAFVWNGIQYPANFLRLATEQEKAELGIQWVKPEPVWDQRFYWGYAEDGSLIPKDHSQLIQQWTQQTRTTANSLLQPSDWMVVREADNGSPMDPLIKQWREDIRAASSEKIVALEATIDTPSLASYVTSGDYASWPHDPYSIVPSGDSPSDGLEPSSNG